MEIILFVFIALNVVLAYSLLIKKLAKKLNSHTLFQKTAVTTSTLFGSFLTMSFSTAPAAKTTILGISPIKNYASDYSQTQINSLKNIYAQNKKLLSSFGHLFSSYNHHIEHKVDGITIKKRLGLVTERMGRFCNEAIISFRTIQGFQKRNLYEPRRN